MASTNPDVKRTDNNIIVYPVYRALLIILLKIYKYIYKYYHYRFTKNRLYPYRFTYIHTSVCTAARLSYYNKILYSYVESSIVCIRQTDDRREFRVLYTNYGDENGGIIIKRHRRYVIDFL